MKDAKRLLPIGSVVLLKDGEKRVMITGFYVTTKNNETYDYCGCVYPEGVLSSEETLVFNHNQIVKMFHKGLEDQEEKEFIQKLYEYQNK